MAVITEVKNGTTDKPTPLGEAWRLRIQSALAQGGAHVEKPVVDVQQLKTEIKQAIENVGADQE